MGGFGSGPGAKEAERGRGRISQDDIINCMLETAKNPTIITGNMVKRKLQQLCFWVLLMDCLCFAFTVSRLGHITAEKGRGLSHMTRS